MAIIFCNLCFETHSQLKKKFYVSPCSHVFCHSCIVNLRNFCPICKIQCKMLEINQQMPSEVKMFFEENSIARMIKNAQKIHLFQTNQIQMYAEKHKPHQQNYVQLKKHILKLQNIKKHYLKKMKQEDELMKRLRQAYTLVSPQNEFNIRWLFFPRTNIITPDLFAPLGGSGSGSSIVSSPRSSVSSPSFSSVSRTSFNQQYTKENPLCSSKKSSPSPRSSLKEPRSDLLKMTLHNMQRASHQKYMETRRQQLKK